MDTPINGVVPPQEATVTPVENTVPTPVETTPIETPVKKSNKVLKIVLITLGVFFGLIALIFVIVNTSTKEPLKVSNDFLAAFTASDSETAYSLTSSDFKESVSASEFETFFNEYKVLPFSEAKVIGKSIEKTNALETATITYSLEYDSEEYTIENVLIKENDQWKVLSMSVE